MDQAPSNGEAVASTQGRLGYEAYFAQLPEPQEDRQRRYDPSHAPESGSEPDTHTAAATAETAARHVVSAEPGVTEQSSIPMLAASAPLIGEPPFTSLHTIDLGNVSKENESQSGSRSADGAHAVHGGARAYSRQHSVTDAHAGSAAPGATASQAGRPQPPSALSVRADVAPTAANRVGGTDIEQTGMLPIALTSAELLADIAASRQAQLRSTSGVRGALNRVGFNLGLSQTEQQTESRHARIRRQLNTPYQIAVLSVKGGVGRTTTVSALGSTFAGLRPDRVVAVDANPDFGDLPSRSSRHPFGLTLRDLAQATKLEAYSAVQSFTSIANSDLAVVASPWSPSSVEALSGAEYLSAVGVLRKHYNLMLIDCGTGVLDSVTATVLRTSDAAVVATPATVRGVTGAVATLEWLNRHGLHRLVASSIIAIVHQQSTKPVVEVNRIEELFDSANHSTFQLPYDEHLAEGGEIDLRLVQKDTALAFEELAAALADGFPAESVGQQKLGGHW